ncbi:hypothetical protein IFM89_011688 [Coptis chinensis]|uniref:Uncharacterized protein n=1 Tax=Coptis chinensis TaxID=261450 RepID=A0A835LAS8_9MAGN|nr:hypothetical protein IFM89_011688 [Coptis chinensis]
MAATRFSSTTPTLLSLSNSTFSSTPKSSFLTLPSNAPKFHSLKSSQHNNSFKLFAAPELLESVPETPDVPLEVVWLLGLKPLGLLGL